MLRTEKNPAKKVIPCPRAQTFSEKGEVPLLPNLHKKFAIAKTEVKTYSEVDLAQEKNGNTLKPKHVPKPVFQSLNLNDEEPITADGWASISFRSPLQSLLMAIFLVWLELDLHGNKLTGAIPPQIGRLRHLRTL
eukprot:Gb_06940 [translate_table: standard]